MPWLEILIWVVSALLLVVNAVGVVMVIMQLPGTWLMLLATALMAGWQTERITWWCVHDLAVLAVLGEIIETFAAARGSAKAGGSKRGAVVALALAIVGAIAGTVIAPVIGTVIGACVGAGLGSYLGDRWAGRTHKDATEAGKGAAVGRWWGTIGKVAIAVVMWIVTAVAVFWN